jgi:hypothetical protein
VAELNELSVRVRVSLNSEPPLCGVKSTATAHCAPAASGVLVLHVVEASTVKFDVPTAMPLKANAWLPASETVTDCGLLVERAGVLGNANGAIAAR